MTVGERLKIARKAAKLSGEKLGELIGVSKGQVSNIEKGSSNLTKGNAIVLADALGVSFDWLYNGLGEMVLTKGSEQKEESFGTFNESYNPNNIGAKISVNFKSAQNENEPKQTYAKHFPEVKEENYTALPFIPVSARASFVDRFPDMNFQEMGSFPVYNLSPEIKKKNPVVVEVDGDSMEPQLRSKTKVLVVPVDPGDWQYISGKVVAIVFDNQFTIKRISENTITREGGGVVLKADNGGATLAVPASAIRQIWQVEDIVQSKVV